MAKIIGVLLGLIIGIVLLFATDDFLNSRPRVLNYYEQEEAISFYNRLMDANFDEDGGSRINDKDKELLERQISKIGKRDFRSMSDEARTIQDTYGILNKYSKKEFVYFHSIKTNVFEWFCQNWLIIIIIVTLPSLLGLHIGETLQTRKYDLKKTVEEAAKEGGKDVSNALVSKFPCVSGQTRSLHLGIETYLPELLRDKVKNSVRILMKQSVVDVLEDFLVEVKTKHASQTSAGMVWIIPNANINMYAQLAKVLDKKMIRATDNTIYSTNLVPPNGFGDNDIIEHIKEVNKIANELTSDSEPRLLRLQIVDPDQGKQNVNRYRHSFITKVQFLSDLMNKKYDDYVNYYVKEHSTFLLHAGREPAAIKNIMGDYILYGQEVILKWEQDLENLYLIFGSEIIDLHMQIFSSFLEQYDDFMCAVDASSQSPVLNLHAWLKNKGMVS